MILGACLAQASNINAWLAGNSLQSGFQ